MSTRTLPPPNFFTCRFCKRKTPLGDFYCADEPCHEWYREWRDPATPPERKNELIAIAVSLRAMPLVAAGAAIRAFDAAYARMHDLVSGNTPEAILVRCAERLGCEPRQVFDTLVRILEERQHEKPQA